MFAQTDEFPVLAAQSRPFTTGGRLPRWIAGATLLIAAALFAATPITGSGEPAAPASALGGAAQTDFTPRPSHGGIYRAEVATAPRVIRVGESGTWVFRVTRRNHRRVSDAAVELQTRLVDRADSTTATLPARYVGAGRYEVRDVRLTRLGWWSLALTIRGAWGTDSLAFNVVIDRE